MKKVVVSIALLAAFLTSTCFGAWSDNAWSQEWAGGLAEGVTVIETNVELGARENGKTEYKSSLSFVDLFPAVDIKATLDMDPVALKYNAFVNNVEQYANKKYEDDDTKKTALVTDLQTIPVRGKFTITIQYPTGAVKAEDVEAIATVKNLEGFENKTALAELYKETENRVVTNLGNMSTLTLVVETADDLTVADITGKLSDITFNADNLKLDSKYGVHRIDVKLEGKTWIGGDAVEDPAAKVIEYKAQSELPISVSARGTRPRPSSSGGGTVVKPPQPVEGEEVAINIIVPGAEPEAVIIDKGGVLKAEELPTYELEGYAFGGYYLDPYYDELVPAEFAVEDDTTIYVRWINLSSPADLNADDHTAYIKGYPDGTVRPFDNITREEIATIFYRIMTDAEREAIYTEESAFTDVAVDRWSNAAIATMANGGYIKGYPDGTFKPAGNITRAEFATIVARFAPSTVTEGTPYADIAGHWAESYIITAEANRWLDGHADTNFRPDEYITRADVISIINSLLVRYVDEEGLIDGFTAFDDNKADSEYYYEIIEATNAHDYDRAEDAYNELWKAILEQDIIG